MMKKAAAFTLAVLILSGVAYTSSYLSASRGLKEQARELQAKQEEREQEFLLPEKEGQEEKRQPAAVRPGAVKAEQKEPEQEGDPGEDAVFVLVEEFGYVNIYLGDRETVYEFTDIPITSLPEALQNEICTGKGLKGEQELYDFLENYSS